MRVAMALPLDAEQRLADTAGYHGHEVLIRCSGGDELAVRLPQLAIELVVVQATPEHLTPRLVETADALGVRMLVVADDEEQQRHATRAGIVDAVRGPAEWGLLDRGATGVTDFGGGADAAAPHASAPVAFSPLASARVVASDTVDVVTDADADPTTGPTAFPASISAAPPAGAAPPHGAALAPIRRPGTVVAVWGPHGAPGRTSLAIALAAEFAAAGLRTVLADADTHAASVAPSLGLLDEAPGFAAACRLAGIGGLDETQLERLAVTPRGLRHPFRVLTGIGRSARWPELGPERVAGAISAVRRWCEVLVVDVAASLEQDDGLASDGAAPRRNAAALEALRAADRVVAVASADPVGIPRFLRDHAELLDLVEPDPERVTVVVNKLRQGAIGLNPAGQVRQTLARFGGIESAVFVPWDAAAFDAALLGARPLADAAPRSPARTAVRELAEALVPSGAATGVRRRRGRAPEERRLA
jgi:MinD-like ATPase involved in chromosome partitioning or flagellar assembly